MERSSGNISASPHFFQWHIEWYQLQQVERKAGFMGGAGVGAGTRASPWPWPHCTVWSPFPKCPGHMPISNGDSKVGTQSTRRKAGLLEDSGLEREVTGKSDLLKRGSQEDELHPLVQSTCSRLKVWVFLVLERSTPFLDHWQFS